MVLLTCHEKVDGVHSQTSQGVQALVDSRISPVRTSQLQTVGASGHIVVQKDIDIVRA